MLNKWTLRGAVVLSGGFSLLFLGVFAALLGTTLYGQWQSQSWPETQCVIFASRADEHHTRRSTHWNVMVSWRYEVNGTRYEVNDADPAVFRQVHSREDAEAIVARYRPGTTVPCFYNPANPIESALDRSKPPALLTVAAVVVGFLILGVGLCTVIALVVLWRRRESRGTEPLRPPLPTQGR